MQISVKSAISKCIFPKFPATRKLLFCTLFTVLSLLYRCAPPTWLSTPYLNGCMTKQTFILCISQTSWVNPAGHVVSGVYQIVKTCMQLLWQMSAQSESEWTLRNSSIISRAGVKVMQIWGQGQQSNDNFHLKSHYLTDFFHDCIT